MKRTLGPFFLFVGFMALAMNGFSADFSWRVINAGNDTTPDWRVELLDPSGAVRVASPQEGLWSVALSWTEKEPSDWRHVPAVEREDLPNGGVVLRGKLPVEGGELLFRDIYVEKNGLLQGVRRFEYKGEKPLSGVTLSVRFHYEAKAPAPFLPGILDYGNPSGEVNTPGKVPVYHAQPGDLAIFEDHRYPIPLACFEDAEGKMAAAIHSVPSPALRGSVPDQWWSLGVRTDSGNAGPSSEFVLYSGFIGFNRTPSVAKSLQTGPMDYPPATLTILPETIIEKTFRLDLWPISRRGTGFQKAVRTGIELAEPFATDGLPTTDDILRSKFTFAQSRWLEGESPTGPYAGFNMYPEFMAPRIVMGWCGQAAAPGFAFLKLAPRLSKLSGVSEDEIYQMVQKSLDHLATSPVGPDGFSVEYEPSNGKWRDVKDPVSMGQGLYNIALAIEEGRKTKKVDPTRWESFFKAASVSAANRILQENWRPKSTAEGFLIAPLIHAWKIFADDKESSDLFKKAAEKAANYYAERHLSMVEPYWGGTLDASCEDKEGAWAAFQGFLAMFESTGEEKYLDWARHAGEVCLSYLVVWDIPLPPGRLSDHQFKTRGWTVVSPQNQHLDVYGVLFAPEIRKLGRYCGIPAYERVADVMFRSAGQLIDPLGSQGEQIQQTNFAQRGEMTDVLKLRGGYSESWTVFWITAHFLVAAAKESSDPVE